MASTIQKIIVRRVMFQNFTKICQILPKFSNITSIIRATSHDYLFTISMIQLYNFRDIRRDLLGHILQCMHDTVQPDFYPFQMISPSYFSQSALRRFVEIEKHFVVFNRLYLLILFDNYS